ncbi:MAG TPA: inositol monophosphatase family protein [Vicinamibacteria bacterium]|nr:inositol monophosphatase family protein [Vicinamibacteria bacterium]
MPELKAALGVATAAALRAGETLRADLHRAGGPRGHADKAEADTEAEIAIREALAQAFPGWGYLGEETGRSAPVAGAPVWLVDPNDGTRDYLLGRRGSAVSIGLVRDGRPVLGVVYAFAYPDDRGDLFAWAEGCGPLRRNGVPAAARPPEALGAADVVLVSSGGDRDPTMNLRCSEPARYRTVPSIAHRLSLVASGEAAAATSLLGPKSWDLAAGHALVRGAGGLVVDEAGREIAYAADGWGVVAKAFAGSSAVARDLASRDWQSAQHEEWGDEEAPIRLRRGQSIGDPGLLCRAQGCLLGQLAGDSLGSLVEFQSAAEIARSYPEGPGRLEDGGVFDTLAGQPTDDSEMALALARSLVAHGRFDGARVVDAYRRWARSEPFDIGTTTRAALSGYLLGDSQANGSLMRVSPLAIFGHALPAARLAELAREDSALTHPHPVCRDAVAAYVVAAAHAIHAGAGAPAVVAAGLDWARASARPEVVESLEAARHEPPRCDGDSQGWVRIALQNAFYELLHAATLEEGVRRTVSRGGDTDTNAAIAGALLGAVHGREAVPAQWRQAILSCRPHPERARRVRGRTYWPVDALELAERLLLAASASLSPARARPRRRAR